MSKKLPRAKPEEVAEAFERAGFRFERHGKGAHRIYAKPGHPFKIAISFHAGRTIGPGLLRKMIRDAGMTAQEFLAHFRGEETEGR